jgi:hypothetical protein
MRFDFARLRQDRRTVIEVANLDVEIMDHRLVIFDAKMAGRAGYVARIGLLDGELANRPALSLVGGKESGPSHPIQHIGQLPSEIVRIVNAGVAAEPTIGRHNMGRVADQEHAAQLVVARDI